MLSKFKPVAQIAFLSAVAMAMNLLTSALHLKIPGSILGIFVIFFLLKAKIIRLDWVESGAKFLLAELLLFFIPSAVGMISYQSLLLNEGLQIVLVVCLGTLVVMSCSGLVAQIISKRKERVRS